MHRLALAACVLCATTARAGTIVGKLEAPALPERPPPQVRGFLDRIDNPLAAPRNVDVHHRLVIVLEGDEKPASPPAVTWELVGESFARPVIAAAAGAEVVIKDSTRGSRKLVVVDVATGKDTKLLDIAPINPGGTKSFRAGDAGKAYRVVDPDAPYFAGTLVVVNTPFIAYVDDSGRFDLADIPDGTYKVRVYASLPAAAVPGGRDGWIELADTSVRVAAKGKTDLNLKLPADAFAPKAQKK